ncbi:hypothetical protein FCN80_03770 [Martelella alba]|uniref:Uncharacterized protein n=1 Tax=Martelella alba TaxID=2590451 RepID=A0ABY2SV10_9HYPH|nr:hypothetical protein FCN80_03770 [Martelella alba]
MRDIRSLTGGPPLAVHIRSRRICRSLAAAMRLEVKYIIIKIINVFIIKFRIKQFPRQKRCGHLRLILPA